LNWFQDKFGGWFKDRPDPSPPPGGALAKLYGENLSDPDALIHRANKRATGGDIEGAFSDFDEAITLSPARATAFYNRGFLHNTLGNFEAAIDDFDRALEFLPDYDEAYYQRGNGHLQLKDFPKAIQDFGRALQLNPYSIKSYYKRAEAYADSGDMSGALADYAQAIARIPKDANAYYQRGQCLFKMGEMEAAIEDFSVAIGHNPRHADAYCSRGCCYAEFGDLKRASQDFNQALLHNPSHQAAYYQRIYSLGILKDTATPLQSSNQALLPVKPPSTAPVSTPAMIAAELVGPSELGKLLGRGEPSSPSLPNVELHPPTFKLEPESLTGFFERASNRALDGDVDGAIADYTKIIEQDPHNIQAYYHRGQNYSVLGQNDEALQDLNQAIHWARVHSLGQLKDFSGALTETIQTLKTELKKPKPSETGSPSASLSIEERIAEQTRVIESNPTSVEAHFKRAQSRALIGDLQGAIADYSETIRLNPEYSDAYYRRALHRSALGDTSGATQDFNRAIRYKQSQGHSQPLSSSSRPKGRTGTTDGHRTTASSNPVSHCNHEGNRPGTRFCIRCGEPLRPRSARPDALSPSLGDPLNNLFNLVSEPIAPAISEAEALFQLGYARCANGNFKEGLADLGSALKLFLEQQNTVRYLETLKMIQQFSKNL
jgi:tetratricopeptide (TPR) repeat protein